jgi:hypothetical protein
MNSEDDWRSRKVNVGEAWGEGVKKAFCPDRRFIFLHIPKTGGCSVELALDIPVQYHIFLTDLLKHPYWQERELFDDYFKFAFVRNPWSKLVSEYFYVQREMNGSYGRSFSEFVQDMVMVLESNNAPSHKRRSVLDRTATDGFPELCQLPMCHEPRQLPWLVDEHGTMCMDFIGRFENFQEDFDEVCRRIGIKEQTLPHVNASKHGHYSEYYDTETAELVGQVFTDDIKLWGYEYA